MKKNHKSDQKQVQPASVALSIYLAAMVPDCDSFVGLPTWKSNHKMMPEHQQKKRVRKPRATTLNQVKAIDTPKYEIKLYFNRTSGFRIRNFGPCLFFPLCYFGHQIASLVHRFFFGELSETKTKTPIRIESKCFYHNIIRCGWKCTFFHTSFTFTHSQLSISRKSFMIGIGVSGKCLIICAVFIWSIVIENTLSIHVDWHQPLTSKYEIALKTFHSLDAELNGWREHSLTSVINSMHYWRFTRW